MVSATSAAPSIQSVRAATSPSRGTRALREPLVTPESGVLEDYIAEGGLVRLAPRKRILASGARSKPPKLGNRIIERCEVSGISFQLR